MKISAAFWLCLVLASSPAWAEQKAAEHPSASSVPLETSKEAPPKPSPVSSGQSDGKQAVLDLSVVVPPQGPPKTVWVEDTLPENAKTEGSWIWDAEIKTSGKQSHGHPARPGSQSHAFTTTPYKLSLQGQILQQVWLDPNDPPAGIAVRFKLTSGEEVGVYWEGEQEVFTPGEYEEMWYYGLLPELGKWTELEILAEDLGLEGEEITGIRFMTYGGRALWDRTVLTELPTEEKPAVSPPTPAASPQPPAVNAPPSKQE